MSILMAYSVFAVWMLNVIGGWLFPKMNASANSGYQFSIGILKENLKDALCTFECKSKVWFF